MGWWIYLEDEDGIVEVKPHLEGGVITIGGSDMADISVTWNYSKYYYQTIDEKEGFRWLNGKIARETIVRLENAITELGTEFSGDYWESTPGNAGVILQTLVGWAYEHLDATWRVS